MSEDRELPPACCFGRTDLWQFVHRNGKHIISPQCQFLPSSEFVGGAPQDSYCSSFQTTLFMSICNTRSSSPRYGSHLEVITFMCARAQDAEIVAIHDEKCVVLAALSKALILT